MDTVLSAPPTHDMASVMSDTRGDSMREGVAPAIRLRDVTRTFGALRAVNGVDLEIQRGEAIALLGPNGAGKTTTISMLLGLLLPTTGSVEVFGMSPNQAIRQSRVGAMLQDGKLMPGVRVGELVDFVRGLHPHPLPREELLDLAGIRALEKRPADRLSGGQTQRVRFALAIAGNPALLVLDEPTAALDVEARREFWDVMHAYAAQGHTILFATHYLEEAANSASRLVIMARGRVLVDGTVPDIQVRFGQPRVAFTALEGTTSATYARLPGVRRAEALGERITLHTEDPDATVRALVTGGTSWKELEVTSNDLEEIFISLVQHGQRGKEAAQ